MDISETYDLFLEYREQNKPLSLIADDLQIPLATLRRWESERINEAKIRNQSFLGGNTNYISVDEISPWKDTAMIMWRLGFAAVAAIALLKVSVTIRAFLLSIL